MEHRSHDEPVGTPAARRRADLGGDRRPALRPRLPARLPPDRQPPRRRGPHPGGLRPGVPAACRPTRPAPSRAGCTGSPRTSSSTRPAASSGSASTRSPTSAPTGSTAPCPTPDTAYADRTFDDDIERALATLPPEFRAAVVLCDVEGLSYEEIAEILDAKLGTVRSRIHRGRAMLRTALAHRAPAEGRTRYPGPRRRCARPRPRERARDRPPRRPGQRAPRRPAVPGRRGARLGARALLPPVPRRGRARGLGEDPAGHHAVRRLRGARPTSRARCSCAASSTGPTCPTHPALAGARRAGAATSA